jgi:hypothetical protein
MFGGSGGAGKASARALALPLELLLFAPFLLPAGSAHAVTSKSSRGIMYNFFISILPEQLPSPDNLA